MKALIGFLALLASAAAVLNGAEPSSPDDFVQQLISRSTLIVDGDIVKTSRFATSDEFTSSFSVEVSSREALHGIAPRQSFRVKLSGRPFDVQPQPAYLRKGQRCVFFLRENTANSGNFVGVDYWLSAQPYSVDLVSAVRASKKLQ